MQVEDGRWSWERGIPLRYLLAADGGGQVWARCADAEGLFADPVPAPRERLTFLGCDPAGPLRTAVEQPAGTAVGLGELCLEVGDGKRPVEWWGLTDAEVVDRRPSSIGPALVDVVVETGVEEPEEGRAELTGQRRFELFEKDSLGTCEGVEGLYVERPETPQEPMKLIGCEPTEQLRAVLDAPESGAAAELWALDRSGRPMTSRSLALEVGEVRPSALGGELLDITLTGGVDDPPPLLAGPVWEAWYEGVPDAPNEWARFTPEGRHEWLKVAFRNRVRGGADTSGGTYHVDGTHATDVYGLHCALGEALHGPGGYYGMDWQSFNDCLGGGAGVVPPFTLVWHDAENARRALAGVVEDPEEGLTYFEEIVRRLERYGVVVELQ
ncbi:barstar family protein [Streptomyces chrestomyceticus]|uniref:Barstar family protein n=1 Tax=Streptomyces chrestomyceticus TaxID=68185 RepID=A0ABU7WV51_9ACTN